MAHQYSYILDSFYIPVVSPYGLLMNILNPKSYGCGAVMYTAILAIFDSVVIIISFILFMKRPGEAAGKTLAFRSTGTPLKLIIAIPAVAFTGVAVAGVLDRSRDLNVTDMGLIVFVCIIAAIVACAVIQAVFELDIRAAVNAKRHWIVCAVGGLLIFFGYKYDFFNLDRYVPNAGKVESAVFIPNGYEDIYGWMDEEHESMSGDEFGLAHMFIQNVDEVCELHRLSIARYDELIRTVDDYEYEYDEDRRFSAATVIYRMKNGRLMARQIYVPVRDSSAVYLLDKIMSQDDFVNGYYPVMALDTDKAVDKTPYTELGATYTDCLHTQMLTAEELKELIRMYRKDLWSFSYSGRLEELPIGYLDFCLSAQGEDAFRSYYGSSCQSITIYSGMENCIAYLRDKGFDFADRPLAGEAEQIVITNYHLDEQDERAKELGVPYLSEEEAEEFIRSETYEPTEGNEDMEAEDDGKDKFALVASALHPCDRGTYRWDAGKSYDDKYEVSVFLKDRRSNPYGINCCFVEDEVPEFVMEDLEL